MLHEFKVNGEMAEVTVAREGQEWLLGEYRASVLTDGRIMVQQDGRSRIAHSAKVGDVWWVHIDGHIFCIEKTEAGSADGDSDGGIPREGAPGAEASAGKDARKRAESTAAGIGGAARWPGFRG